MLDCRYGLCKIVLLIYVFLHASSYGSQESKQLLLLPGESIDKGIITAEEPIDFIFTIKNTGEKEVELIKVMTTCKCAVVEAVNGILPAKSQENIKIKVSAPFQSGLNENLIYLRTSCKGQEVIKLTTKFQYGYKSFIDPPAVFVGDLVPGIDIKREIRLLFPRNEITQFLKSVTCESKKIKIDKITEPYNVGLFKVVQIDFLAKCSNSDTELILQLENDSGVTYNRKVPVILREKPLYQVSPTNLYFVEKSSEKVYINFDKSLNSKFSVDVSNAPQWINTKISRENTYTFVLDINIKSSSLNDELRTDFWIGNVELNAGKNIGKIYIPIVYKAKS